MMYKNGKAGGEWKGKIGEAFGEIGEALLYYCVMGTRIWVLD